MKPPSSSRLSSLAARDMADFAASIRHRPGHAPPPGHETSILTYFSQKRQDWRMKRLHGPQPHDDHPGHHAPPWHDGVVTPVDTPMVQPHRPRIREVSLQLEDGELESLSRYDAVFWSEASVEKFVLPYYASKCQWSAAMVLTELTKQFYGYVPNPAADNRPRVAADEAEERDADLEVYPFAIGHLPRSDYAELEEGTSLAHEVWLLFRTPGGKVEHRSLAEFL
jgi:hypothetical protein